MTDTIPASESFLADPLIKRMCGASPTVLSSERARHMRVYRSLLDHAFHCGVWWGDIPVGLVRKKVPLAVATS